MAQPGVFKYTCRTIKKNESTKSSNIKEFIVCVFGELTVKNFHCKSNLNNLICGFDEDHLCTTAKNTIRYKLRYSYDSTPEHRMCNRNKYPEANLSKKKVHCLLQ